MKIKFINTKTSKELKELNNLYYQIVSLDYELTWANKNSTNSEIKKLLRIRKDYSYKFNELKEELVKKVLLGVKK